MTINFSIKAFDKEGNEFVKIIALTEDEKNGKVVEFGELCYYRLCDLTTCYPYDQDLHIDTAGRIVISRKGVPDIRIPKEVMNELLEELVLLCFQPKSCDSLGYRSMGLCPNCSAKCKKEARSRIASWAATTNLINQGLKSFDMDEKVNDERGLIAFTDQLNAYLKEDSEKDLEKRAEDEKGKDE